MRNIHFDLNVSTQIVIGINWFRGSEGKGFTISLLCFDFSFYTYFDEQYCYED